MSPSARRAWKSATKSDSRDCVIAARNPAIKDDLFAYTMIGFGMVELVMFIVIIMSSSHDHMMMILMSR